MQVCVGMAIYVLPSLHTCFVELLYADTPCIMESTVAYVIMLHQNLHTVLFLSTAGFQHVALLSAPCSNARCHARRLGCDKCSAVMSVWCCARLNYGILKPHDAMTVVWHILQKVR